MAKWAEGVIPILALALSASGQYDGDKIAIARDKLSKLPHDQCGDSSDTVLAKKVVNGQAAALGTYPWMAALGFTWGNSVLYPTWACGGSLITDQYVLTAAHCLDPATTMGFRVSVVRLGDLDLDSTEDGAKPMDLEVEATVIHPQFNNDLKINDVGLIKLKKKVEFHDLLKPICLPSPEFQTNSFVGEAAVVAVWGNTESHTMSSKLREAELHVTDLEQCRSNLTSKLPHVTIDNRVVCAYAKGKDSCHGDSGSPLMMFRRYRNRRRMYILGIVSYGNKCGEEGVPGVYTRVSQHMEWIIDNIDV